MKTNTLLLAIFVAPALLITAWVSSLVTARSYEARLPGAVSAKQPAAVTAPNTNLPPPAKANPEAPSRENKVLRDLARQQRQDLDKRAAAAELLKDELARLGAQSGTLDAQLAMLSGPGRPLSDDQRAIFKDDPVFAAGTLPPNPVEETVATALVADTNPPSDLPAAPVPPAVAATPVAPPTPPEQPPAETTPVVSAPRPDTILHPPVAAASVELARKAREDFDGGRYAEAGKAYAKLLALEPKNPYLIASQGLVLLRQGNIQGAEDQARKATAIAPRDATARALLGIVYFKKGKFDEAVTTLTQAVQLDPQNAMAHNYLGITSSQKGWPEAAVDEVQKAIALRPYYAEAHFNIAVIYATSQPPAKERAEEHYKIATSLGAAPDPALEKLLRN